jgi:hypothetical protein
VFRGWDLSSKIGGIHHLFGRSRLRRKMSFSPEK